MEARGFRIGVVIALVVLLTFVIVNLAYSRARCCLIYWPDGQNVLRNGSFEEDSEFRANLSGGLMTLPPGSTAMPGWAVVGATNQDVVWGPNSNAKVPNGATDGKYFLDLTGISDKTANGIFAGVRQVFDTPGRRYDHELSFDIMVSNQPGGLLSGPITVTALLTNEADGPDGPAYAQLPCGPFNPPDPGNHSMRCTKQFRAQSARTVLTIKGISGKQYIGLDNVSVQCVSPFGLANFCS